MTVLHNFPDGRWCDVVDNVFIDGTLVNVRAWTIDAAGNLHYLWAMSVPEPLMFLRAVKDIAPNGHPRYYAFGKGNYTGAAYLIGLDYIEKVAPIAWGNNPCAVMSTQTIRPVLYWTDKGVLWMRDADGQVHDSAIPFPWTGTAQGILDVPPDGGVIYMDAGRQRQVNGWTFSKPNERHGIVVGQTDPPAIRLALPDGRVFTAIPGLGDDPHLSVVGTRIYVAAYTPGGSTIATIDEPYPAS